MGDDLRGWTLLTLCVAVAFVATPLRVLWAQDGAPWWSPYAVWAALVAAAGWLAWRWSKRDG